MSFDDCCQGNHGNRGALNKNDPAQSGQTGDQQKRQNPRNIHLGQLESGEKSTAPPDRRQERGDKQKRHHRHQVRSFFGKVFEATRGFTGRHDQRQKCQYPRDLGQWNIVQEGNGISRPGAINKVEGGQPEEGPAQNFFLLSRWSRCFQPSRPLTWLSPNYLLSRALALSRYRPAAGRHLGNDRPKKRPAITSGVNDTVVDLSNRSSDY